MLFSGITFRLFPDFWKLTVARLNEKGENVQNWL